MFERGTARMLPLTNRVAEYAPMAPACCNACRVCATNGAVGLVFAGVGALAAVVARFVRRIVEAA